jgi:PPOX class probable F420-dependent enzyme
VLFMAHKMTDDEVRTFLSTGTRTGKLATVRADGSPHVAPIWFILDGDDLVFMTGAGTAKGKALRRDPRVALVVDLEQPPYGFALVEGTVTISTDLDEMLPLSIRIAERYVSAEQAEQFGRRNAVDGELLVRLHPSRITAIDDMTA